MSAHLQGLSWDGTGLHADTVGIHKGTGQSDSEALDQQM